MVDLLATEFIRRGHAVTLFAAAGSRSTADATTLLDRQHPDEIQMALYEAEHTARAFEDIDAAATPTRLCTTTAASRVDRGPDHLSAVEHARAIPWICADICD